MSALFSKIAFSASFFPFCFIDDLKDVHCENPYILFIEGISEASKNLLELLRGFYTRGLSSIAFLEHYHFKVIIKASELKAGILIIQNEYEVIRFFKPFLQRDIAKNIGEIIDNLTIENFEESFEDIYNAFSSVEFCKRFTGAKSKATLFQAIVDKKLEMINRIISNEDPLKVLEDYCDIFIQTVSENLIANTSLGIPLPTTKSIFQIVVYDMTKQDFYNTAFLIPKIEPREIDLENPYKFLTRLFVRENEENDVENEPKNGIENDVKKFINECLGYMDRYFQAALKSCIEDL